MSTKTSAAVGCTVMSGIALFYLGIVWLISLWTDRNLDFWFSYFKGETIDIPMWLSMVTSFFLSPICLGLNVVAELAKFAV